MIRGVKIVSIPVRDQDKALAFYSEILGFKVLTDQPMGENHSQRWIELRTPAGDPRIALFTPPGQEDRIGGFCNVVFTTDNIQKTYEELKEKGVEFVQAPKKESWGTSCLFKDPDGNTFCMSSH